jgi:hypothetical protein
MFFGPLLSLENGPVTYVSLIPKHLKQGCAVAGLIVNTLFKIENKLTIFGAHCESRQNLGVAGEIAPLPESRVSFPAVPKILKDSWWPNPVKVTRASLTKVKQLRIQRRLIWPDNDLRCAGLLIHHTDGSIETLGCWDGSVTTPSNLIFDSETDGELRRLVFHLKFRNSVGNCNKISYYMSNIVAHTDRPLQRQVVEEVKYIIDDQEFEFEEMEDGEMEDEETEGEEAEEIVYPPEKQLDWDVSSLHPVSIPLTKEELY